MTRRSSIRGGRRSPARESSFRNDGSRPLEFPAHANITRRAAAREVTRLILATDLRELCLYQENSIHSIYHRTAS